MQRILAVKKDPVQVTVIHGSAANKKQTFSQHSRTVPSIVGYLDSGEVSWSENPDSAASMFSPSLNVWEETFMDLESVCAMKSPSDMADDIKHMSSAVADDELNTPIIGNEFSFNPSGVSSHGVISPAPCLNFGNVSDSWENLYVSPRSVTNIQEVAALKEPSSLSDMCLNPVQGSSVATTTLKLPTLTQTTELFHYRAVPPTSVQNSNISRRSVVASKTGPNPVAGKAPVSNSGNVTSIPAVMALPAIAASSDVNSKPVLYHTEGLQSVTITSTTNSEGNMNMTAVKDNKRKELKLNMAPVFNFEDISTPVVFEALDADGNVNLMEIIANDDINLSSDLDALQCIIAQAEEEAENHSETTNVQMPVSVLDSDAISYTTSADSTETALPVKVEPVTSIVHVDETENIEVWQVKEEDATPQMGLKLKILKQKKNSKTVSEKKKLVAKKLQGKRTSTRKSSISNKSDDYCYDDDDDDDEEYVPTKRSRSTQRRRLTSASSSSSIGPSPGTSRHRPSVTQVADIEDRYRELRDKNNEASRKSRLNRKAREVEMQAQLTKLQQENQTLRIRADELEKIVAKLRESLVEIVKNPRH